MNNPKVRFILLATFVLLFVACKKEDAGQDAHSNDNITPVEEGATNTQSSQSAILLESVQKLKSETSQKSPHEARGRITADIVEMIGKPDGGLTHSHWRKIKERYWLPRFDRIVRDSDDAMTTRELLATPEGETPLLVQLLSGSFETEDSAEEEAFLALHTMALFTASSGGASLPAALVDRAKDPRITQGDVIMFEVFSDAFVEMPRNTQMPNEILKEWEDLTSSPNALVRLLALRSFSKVAREPQQWLEFYRSYKNESDPLILEEATSLAFLTSLPDAADFLSEIRDKVGQETSSTFSEKLDRSINFLRLQSDPE